MIIDNKFDFDQANELHLIIASLVVNHKSTLQYQQLLKSYARQHFSRITAWGACEQLTIIANHHHRGTNQRRRLSVVVGPQHGDSLLHELPQG